MNIIGWKWKPDCNEDINIETIVIFKNSFQNDDPNTSKVHNMKCLCKLCYITSKIH